MACPASTGGGGRGGGLFGPPLDPGIVHPSLAGSERGTSGTVCAGTGIVPTLGDKSGILEDLDLDKGWQQGTSPQRYPWGSPGTLSPF